jgi:C-terminal processing protease CtpA/Prc
MKLWKPVLLTLLCLLAGAAWAADRGYFGFAIAVDGEGFFLNPTLKSVKIETVVPNSPAALAGIRPGDLIVEVEGHAVAGTKADVLKPYLQRDVGQSTRLLVRKSTGETVAVVLVAAQKVQSP